MYIRTGGDYCLVVVVVTTFNASGQYKMQIEGVDKDSLFITTTFGLQSDFGPDLSVRIY